MDKEPKDPKAGDQQASSGKASVNPNFVEFPAYDRIKQLYIYGEENSIKGLGFEIVP